MEDEEVRETERLRSRRARARAEAVVSGEGGSPKMKNLMKQPIRMTTESWPSRKPCVNERLGSISAKLVTRSFDVPKSSRGLLC